MVCSHRPTKRPIQRPTEMGCIELIIMCVGVGVGQCEHTIRIKLRFIRAKATSYEENQMNIHIEQRQLSKKTNRFCFHSSVNEP